MAKIYLMTADLKVTEDSNNLFFPAIVLNRVPNFNIFHDKTYNAYHTFQERLLFK